MADLHFVSWNVNGLRACRKKGFDEFLAHEDPDFICLQEVKLNPKAIPEEDLGYLHRYYHLAEKNGYSGTSIFSKVEPLNVEYDILPEQKGHSDEGRVITAEYDKFFLVNVYTPNSKSELERLDYRYNQWDPDFRQHLLQLQETKPVVSCGDFNVAHNEIDLARPSANHKSAGFTDQEREGMTALIDSGFIDTFRHINPNETDAYTWWSFRGGARQRNVGWRIDYFLVSEILQGNIKDATILSDVLGSDHCPVTLKLSF